MIKMIAAVSQNGILGKNGTIPWTYLEDIKHFGKMTNRSTVIMGRKTFASLARPLPSRRNIIIQSILNTHGGRVLSFSNLASAIEETTEHNMFEATVPEMFGGPRINQDIWLIGGARIYEEGMRYASEIWLTIVPDVVSGENLTRMPWINPRLFRVDSDAAMANDERLRLVKYVRIIA